MLVHLNLPGWRLATLRRTMGLMIIAFWLGVMLLVTQPASTGLAQGTSTTICLEPSFPLIDDVGDTVTVDIRIEDVTDLYGIDVRLSFDPALLEAQDADGDPANGVQIQGGSFPAPNFRVKNEADNGAGTVWYAVSQMSPTEPISGTGVVASVTFQGLTAGISPVEFTYQKMVKRNGDPIPATTEDGEIEIGAAGPTAIALSSFTASSGVSLAWPWLVGAATLVGGVLWVRRPSNRQRTPNSE